MSGQTPEKKGQIPPRKDDRNPKVVPDRKFDNKRKIGPGGSGGSMPQQQSPNINHPHGPHGGNIKSEMQMNEEMVNPEDENSNSELLTSEPKKFTGRCRLFVGNLPPMEEEEFRQMFLPFGEVSEVYLNPSRSFGFVKLDTRQNAETAKAALDGLPKGNRVLRVRFATHGAALRVKHLSPHVSNELLEQAFGLFGQVERAIVIVDDRGRPTGEGIVEFARKPGAMQALKRINDGVFLLTSTPRPVIAEPLEQKDEEDGYPERFMPKSVEFQKEREQQPRFANPGSFEYEFSLKWKELYVVEKHDQEALKQKTEANWRKLELDMEAAYHEYQTHMLRQDLLRRQDELRRLEEQHQQLIERNMTMRRRVDEDLTRRVGPVGVPEDDRRRQDMMRQQHEEMRRRQQMESRELGRVDDLFVQQDEDCRRQKIMRPDDMRRRDLGRPEEIFGQDPRPMVDMRGAGERGIGAPPMQPPPAPPVALGVERGGASRQVMGGGSGGGAPLSAGGMGNSGGAMNPANMHPSINFFLAKNAA